MAEEDKAKAFIDALSKRCETVSAWKEFRRMYEDIISAGFSEEQAMRLLCVVVGRNVK